MIVNGKSIKLRTVEIEDAEFIYLMRNNDSKTKYLTKVTGTIESQEKWIKFYKKREIDNKEFYFVIESNNDEKLGLVRIYDFQLNSFCWGSWLIKENAPITTAIESALLTYEFAFYQLGFEKSHFEVQKGNDKVISFHKRFGANIISENELEYFFNFEKNDYEKIKKKYKRYLK